jgi:hypothetical protein
MPYHLPSASGSDRRVASWAHTDNRNGWDGFLNNAKMKVFSPGAARAQTDPGLSKKIFEFMAGSSDVRRKEVDRPIDLATAWRGSRRRRGCHLGPGGRS